MDVETLARKAPIFLNAVRDPGAFGSGVRVSFQSTITPDVEVQPLDPALQEQARQGSGLGGLLFGILKPTVRISTPAGDMPPLAPWGPAEANLIPLVALGAAAFVGGVYYLGYRAGKKPKRARRRGR